MAITVRELVTTWAFNVDFATLKAMDTRVATLRKETGALGKNIREVGGTLTRRLTLPIIGFGAAAAAATIGFEQALTGVSKTVDLTSDELKALGDRFKTLSERIPISAKELLGLAENAGQLGIEKQNLDEFVETVAALGVSTNLAAEDAAFALARIAASTGLPQKEIGRLGSVIVELGNNFATTEREIVQTGLRLVGAANVAGITQQEALGLAAAISSVGVGAEAGGTAISTFIAELQTAVKGGGAPLAKFAEIAGLSGEQLRALFERDAARALDVVIKGFGRLNDEGANVFKTLEEVGLADRRLRDVILRLAGSGDLLSETLATANQEFLDNNALTAEASKFYGTLGARATTLFNKLKNVTGELGEQLRPAFEFLFDVLEGGLDLIRDGIKLFGRLPGPIRTATIAFVGFLAVLGPLLIALIGSAGLLFAAKRLTGAMLDLNAAFLIAGGQGILGFIGSMLLAAAVPALLATAIFLLVDDIIGIFTGKKTFFGDIVGDWIWRNITFPIINGIEIAIEQIKKVPAQIKSGLGTAFGQAAELFGFGGLDATTGVTPGSAPPVATGGGGNLTANTTLNLTVPVGPGMTTGQAQDMGQTIGQEVRRELEKRDRKMLASFPEPD